MKHIITIVAMSLTLTVTAQNTFSHKSKNAEVILLSEGQRVSNLNNLIGLTPEIIAEVAPDKTFPGATNAFLIRSGGKNILIDTGHGRELFNNLKAFGVSPQDIDVILLTHLHGDHIGGLVKEGVRTFPKAGLYLSKKEFESASESALKIINQYSTDMVLFDPGIDSPERVYEGVKSMACYGHTPGHTAFIVDDLVIWGDLTHAMAVQMPYPNVAITYDTDPEMAIKSRLKMLDYIVQNRLKAAGMHIPFPAIGSVKSNDKGGFVFEPAYFK
jgi:glyoxylase-like metal-dependent hydrolase (beta-lactamase superfamily II)